MQLYHFLAGVFPSFLSCEVILCQGETQYMGGQLKKFEKLSVTVFVCLRCSGVIGLDWLSGRSEETTRSLGTQCLDVAAKTQHYTENELAFAKPT